MRICIISPGQPSNNPRLVKEADALAEAGHDVHAICADNGLWPSSMDPQLMNGRRWTLEYAAGSPRRLPGVLRRIRHKLARQIWDRVPLDTALHRAAISHVAPELARASTRFKADLYISHHPEALPAAVMAAEKFRAKVGYDAEDLHAGMWPPSQGPGRWDRLAEQIEKHYLPTCDYVTSAAPGFSDYYSRKYGILKPCPILNLFPLSERPPLFRPGNPKRAVRLYWFSQTIGEKRGLEDVVQSLGLLRGLPIELHLRGNWKAGYQEKFFALASSLGLHGAQISVHPPASPDEMVRLASEYDIGLTLEQPVDSNRDLCLPNKLFVYLLAGNAIAATRTLGQNSVSDTLGNAAFSYEPGDVKSLAAGIRHWCSDRKSLDAARERAWRWGTERYNWDLEKQKFLSLVESIFDSSESALTPTPSTGSTAGRIHTRAVRPKAIEPPSSTKHQRRRASNPGSYYLESPGSS